MPVSSSFVGSTFQRAPTSVTMRARLAASASGLLSPQVRPIEVGEIRIAPKLRASRSQLQRKLLPSPDPPCSAVTSGQLCSSE